MPSHHRRRIVKRLQNQVSRAAASFAAASTSNDNGDDPPIPPPAPGQMRLFSYYAPSLKAGPYTITVDQLIHAPHGSADTDPKHTLNLHSTQEFEVYGLRFSLPAGAVHQSYPPQGHADHNLVLPHIVFADAHLPWEQVASPSGDSPSGTGDQPRNNVPWLALLVFTEDELALTPEELKALSSGTSLTQSKTTMAVNMTLGNVLGLNQISPSSSLSVVTPVRDHPDDPIDQTQAVDMVFPRGDLFTTFFCSYDGNGNRIIPTNGTPDLSRYKYLAHVRNINTLHMADAGVEDEGLYSVIVSQRCGPTPGPKRQLHTPRVGPPQPGPVSITLPKSTIVHLVSLQGIESFIKLPFSDPTTTLVGLVSLYSWTYTCLPPDSVNFVDTMRIIGRQIPQPLRAPDALIASLLLPSASDAKPGPVKSAQRLRDRLTDGYSLLRYLPRTGEQTVAFSRGPLTPTLPAHPPADFWPSQCNFSTSLQTLDAHLGIMDITYSAAWELGRTLAIADRAFTAAVVRVRRATNIYATTEAKKEMLGDSFRGKQQIIGNLPDAIKLLAQIPGDLADGSRVVDPTKRWKPSQVTAPAQSPEASPELRKLFVKHAHEAVKFLSSASTPADGKGDLLPYNEVNIPNNTDWSLVLGWIVNKLYLYNIPAHYLISDPSHLPRESIRFFYIDPTWMDSLIDGALSVGNHLERADDVVRQAMKYNLNKYFATPIDKTLHPYKPQIPTYGFMLRSAVVQAFPNLQIHAPWRDLTTGHPDPRAETLRLELLDTDVLLCLFDRLPGSMDFASGITLSQPPHQQRFAVGTRLGPNDNGVNELEFEFRKVYTSTVMKQPPDTWSPLSLRTWGEGEGEVTQIDPVTKKPIGVLNPPNPSVVFDWDNNTLVVEAFAKTCNNVLLQELGTQFFDDTTPSSALVGVELNDAINKITLATPSDAPTNPRPDSRPRFIHLTPDDLPYSPPATPTTTASTLIKQTHPSAPRPSELALATTPPGRPLGIFNGQFRSSAFIIGHVGNPILPMHRPDSPLSVPADIIFSFTPTAQLIPNLNIFQIQVRIPIGNGAQHLFSVYDGPGGRMLSNQRFNVHIGTATTDNFVFVTLVPRSTTHLVPLSVNPDVSFILNQVKLNGVSGIVKMDVIEDYRNKGEGNDPTKWPIVGPGRTTIQVQKSLLST